MKKIIKHYPITDRLIVRRGYIIFIDHNPSWKENQRKKKREFLDPRVTNITTGRHKQKGLHLLFFLTF